MASKKFDSLHDLGKYLGRPEVKPESKQEVTQESSYKPELRRERQQYGRHSFAEEEQSLRAQLAQAQYERNKNFEMKTLTRLGKLYRKQKRYAQAIDCYEKVLKISPNNHYAFDGLGLVYREKKNYKEAIKWFEKEGDNIIGLSNLANIYCKLDEYDKVIKYALAVIKKDKDNIVAMDNLGIAYRKKKNYDKAIDYFKKKLEIDPKDKQAMDGLGITYREMGDYTQAIDCFKKNLEIDPKDKQAMDGLGITYREMGDYTQAIDWFRKNLEIDPKDKYTIKGLRQTFEKMGTTKEAIQCLKRYLIDSKDNYASTRLMSIADIYQKEGKLQESRDILKFLQEIQVETIFPHKPEFQKSESKQVVKSESKTQKSKSKPPHKETVQERIQRLEKEIKNQEATMLRSQRMAMIGTMTAGISHEIMQPLQIILGVAQNCQLDIENDVIEKQQLLEDLKEIAETTKRLDNIISHLHVFARERKPQAELININEVIESSLNISQQQLKNRYISITKNLADHLSPIKADKIQLELVILNLINNARDALESTENKHISIISQAKNGEIHISIEDNGEGIGEENLSKVFDAFMTTKEKGMGLGLYIVQDIVHSYGGEITVQSQLSEKTEFLITFPIATQENLHESSENIVSG